MILAPHTDDGELGGGGTIAKLSAEGKEVFYVAFCLCSKALPRAFHPTHWSWNAEKLHPFLAFLHQDLYYLIMK